MISKVSERLNKPYNKKAPEEFVRGFFYLPRFWRLTYFPDDFIQELVYIRTFF